MPFFVAISYSVLQHVFVQVAPINIIIYNNYRIMHEYNPLEIPCDWNIARKHALARRTGPDTKDEE